MKKTPREKAVEAIQLVVEKKSFSNIVVNEFIHQENWSKEDTNLFVNIVYGTLDQMMRLEGYLGILSKRPVKKMQPQIKYILLASIYQMLNFDRIPDFAIVNEAVKITKKTNHSASGFVNGILRNFARQKDDLAKRMVPSQSLESLSLHYSYPKWIIHEMIAYYGHGATLNILEINKQRPDLFLRCNLLKCKPNELIHSLKIDGIIVEQTQWIPEALKLIESERHLTKSKAYLNGWFQIQSLGSMMAVDMLDPVPGEKIFDMAAAPGGKSIFMAERMKNTGEILAGDLSVKRLNQLKGHIDRMGISNIITKVHDATVVEHSFTNSFDKVLLDAPCSSLGMIRRKPEIKYAHKNKEQLIEISKIQKEMLRTASKYVKPGGVILYSTCTMLPYENEDVVMEFLEKESEFMLDGEGMKFLNPTIHENFDGFFIAKIRRLEQ